MNLPSIQDKINKFSKGKGISSDINIRVLDLVSEVGELSKEVLKGTDYGSKEFEKTQDWDGEIGDVLFSLITIANSAGTDLENCLNHVLEKYDKRFAVSNSLGSGR